MAIQSYFKINSWIVFLALTMPWFDWVFAEEFSNQENVVTEIEVKVTEPIMMPLTLAVNLNGKYVGQINALVDPSTNESVIEQERFKLMLKPLIDRERFENLSVGLAYEEKYVSLDIVNSMGLVASFDPLSLSVDVVLSASDMKAQDYALTSRRNTPNPDLYQSPSMFTAGVNISASQVLLHRDDENDAEDPQVAFNGLINVGGFGGVTVEAGARYSGDDDDPWERNSIIASKDIFSSAVRISGGEITPGTKGFQGSQRMLGVGIHRAYSSIRPFQIVRPTGRSQFSLDEDSRVEIYVNDILVDTINLNQGSYSLSDFPITSRSNDVRLEIIGRSGRTEVLNFDVYGGSELLAPGLSDFGFYLGSREGDSQFDYSGGLAGTAYYRRGLSGSVSAGATLQATERVQQLGLLLTYGSRYGLFDIEAASSFHANDEELGSAFRLNYRNTFSLLTDNDLRISANGEYRTDHFQSAFDDLEIAPQKWTTALQASWVGLNGWNATIGIAAGETRGFAGGNSSSVNMNIGRRIGDFQFGVTFGNNTSVTGETSERFGLTVGYRPAGEYSTTAQYNSTDEQMQIDMRRRSKQQVEGFNFGVQLRDSEKDQRSTLTTNYNHNRFESSVQHTYTNPKVGGGVSETRSQWRFSSFVGISNGNLGVGRPIQSGFVLANKHKSLRESKVEIHNGSQFVARPGLLGAAVIPISRPYSVNKFEVTVDPLPIGYDMGEGSITVFPGHGSSFNTPIGSDASRTAMGFLILNGEPLALVSGFVSPIGDDSDKEESKRPLFTNRGGRFVADRLSIGEYEIIIDDQVFAVFEIEESDQGLVNLGRLSNE